MKFSYTRYRGGQAPIIPIEVRGRRRWHKVWAYVDSGASHSILRPEEAQRLGVTDLLPQRVAMRSSGGRTLALKLYRLAVRLGSWRGLVTFGVPQGFDLDFNLLGRQDVFEHFIISFREREGQLTFTPRRRGSRAKRVRRR
ncbi:MAG: hypothetical protein A3C53_07115 [Omnitrophica WOR_2 bacterium RIFCSPHIGHO2_02_FULL_68_15]|nr:MAG: hypothetical protein A3C53_07115 [Omnitrophica WOR_2 bacterium RIFCSPHIGHO2_02_FULL_68_15]